MQGKDNKKTIIPLVFAVLTLIALVSTATYAYMTVQTVNNFKTITETATFPEMGSVALAAGSSLTLNLTRPAMMQFSTDKTYYATTNGALVESQTTQPVIGTAIVTGPGIFTCYYDLHVAMSGNLYTAFRDMSNKSNGQIILTINGTDYDFNSATNFTNGFTINGTMPRLQEGANQNITAQLRLINKKDIIQDALIDKNVTFTFTVSNFRCDANF